MNKLFSRLQSFMYGRYGNDKLNTAILAVWVVLAFLNIFLNSIIIYTIYSLLCILYLFRMFSRNIAARRRENEKFLQIFGKAVSRAEKQKSYAEDREHKYVKCKHCSAQLRVRRVKGKHTVKCPKCGANFDIRIF